tara:strand:- start:31 stop:1521 length:1491 start_codon:yes stop_codon:yes gene_type:complete
MADPLGKNASSLKKSFRRGGTGSKPYIVKASGKTRYQVIRDAMQDRVKLTVLSGTTQKDVIFNNKKENNDTLDEFELLNKPIRGYKLRHNGGFVDIGDIYKTPAFGGGFGGKDPGELSSTEKTARSESLQCFYNAALAHNPRLKFEDMSEKVLKATQHKCFTGGHPLSKAYAMNLDWHKSAYFIAKGLLKKKYISKNYTFHRDDLIMKSIYKIKGKAYKNDGITVLSDDKWNPGDIWAVRSDINIEKAFDGYDDSMASATSSVASLNKRIEKLFDDKKVMGISLKAVTKESDLKLKRLNHSGDPRNTKPYKFGYVELAGKTGFFSAKQAYLYADDGTKLLMANKNLGDGPNFEIILKGAKGGGGSWGVAAVAAAERYLGNHKLINNVMQQIVTRSIKAGEEKPIDYLWNNVKTVQNSPLCKDRFDDIVTEEQFREQLKAAREDQIHAKAFQAAMLAALVKASPKNRSLWLDWVINYAGSTLADSSVYLKAYMREGQ